MKTLIGQDLLKAVSSLCQRDMIVLPTETGYMLACNALDAEVVALLGPAAGGGPRRWWRPWA